MKRSLLAAAGLTSLIILVAALAWASSQDGVDDFGLGPSDLTFGDSNQPTGIIATVTLEFRGVPDTGGGLLSNKGALSLQVVARADDGVEFRMITFDYQCGQPTVMDPCSPETICTIGKGNKEVCVEGLVVDFRKTEAVQSVVVSELAPRMTAAYGRDAELINTKLKGYVQSNAPVRDINNIASLYALGDLAFTEE